MDEYAPIELAQDALSHANRIPHLVAPHATHFSKIEADTIAEHLVELERRTTSLRADAEQLRNTFYPAHADERARRILWDRVDPAAPLSPHAWQRDHLEEIERRCAKQRIGRISAPLAADAKRKLRDGACTSICRITELSFDIEVTTVPQSLPWPLAARVHCGFAALRELILSPRFPAYYGHGLMPDAPAGELAATRYFVERVDAPSLVSLLLRASLSEASPVHALWRRQLVEAAHHISTQCTHLPAQALELDHMRAAHGGKRLVVVGLTFGPAFDEPPAGSGGIVAERDSALLRCAVGMVANLSAPTPIAPGGQPAAGSSVELEALCKAARSVKPPTLAQLLSHSYFAELSGERTTAAEMELELLLASC